MLAYRNSTQIEIDAAPERIFAIAADVGRHDELAGSGEVLRVRMHEDGPVNKGTRFEADEDITVGKKHQRFASQSEVVELEPSRTISWTSMPPGRPKPRRIQWWFRLEPVSGGTRVVHEVEVDFGPIANRLMKWGYGRVRGRTVAAGMEKTLANLKALADAETPPMTVARGA